MILSPDDTKRLDEINDILFGMEMADRLTREEQDDRRELLNERERIRRGE